MLAGGALFAAWPRVYAAAFCGLFVGMFLVLFALIVRPAGFKFRSLMPSAKWRSVWDWALFCGGAIPAFLLGVVMGNLFLGIGFAFDADLRLSFSSSFFDLVNPFGLLVGTGVLALLVMHGAIYLQLKTEGYLHLRLQRLVKSLGAVVFLLFAVIAWAIGDLPGYAILSTVDTFAESNPLNKQVGLVDGAWLGNFQLYPWMKIAPIIGCFAFLGAWGYST